MTSCARDAQGHFTSGAGPSHPPGGFPSVSAASNFEEGEEDHQLLATASQADDESIISAPLQHHRAHATSESSLVTSAPAQHQVPPHFHTPSIFSAPIINNPLPHSRIPTYQPHTFNIPAPPAPIPTTVLPPAPAGIDPAIWANNQALILSLLPALQAFYHPPAQPLPPKEGDVKALTSFSGEDHTKLRDFLFKCGLIFDTKPRTLATKKSRVLYAIQHLNGMAKRHFCRYIENGGTDPKVNQWNVFSTELETIFSNPDHEGKASDKLLSLTMKETGQVHQYTVLF